MKQPKRARQWPREIFAAFEAAVDAVKAEHGPKPLAEHFLSLYLKAPDLACAARGISSPAIRAEALAQVKADFESEIAHEPEAEFRALFHFVYAYLDTHVIAGMMSEREKDRVMDHLNENYDLFPEDDESLDWDEEDSGSLH